MLLTLFFLYLFTETYHNRLLPNIKMICACVLVTVRNVDVNAL